MEKAILIPANPDLEFAGGGDAGSIIAHAVTIEKKGFDLWGLFVPGGGEASGFPHSDIRAAYLYDVRKKGVTHVCDIEWIKPRSDVGYREFVKIRGLKFKNRRAFVQWAKRFYAVKITNIFALERVHRPKDFKKWEDGKPVVKVMNYCIVRDPHFVHYNRHLTRDQIMSDHMAALLLRGRVTEKDIEDLFYYRLMEDAKILDRQRTFRNAGRLDLLVKDRFGNLVVYELKKGVARPVVVEQISGYMKACEKKYSGSKKKRIRGVILARDAQPQLLDDLRKEPRIEFKKYWFSIEMK
jgi:hypothetical protein